METYPAYAFHHSLAKGRSSGTLRITEQGLVFSFEHSQVNMTFASVSLELGGASERLLFFKHPQYAAWSIYSSDLSLLEHMRLTQHPALAGQLAKIRQRRRVNWGVFAVVAALLVVAPTLLLFNMDSLSAPLARQIPQAWEQKLGETALKQYRINADFLPDDVSEQVLQPLSGVLTQQLTSTSDPGNLDYHIYVVNDASLNAFALPGGYIVLNSGLVLKADSADELLGVLAHEISHVTQQHGLRNMIGSAGVFVVAQAMLGDVSGLLAVVASAAPLLLNQSYSRQFETEADDYGFKLLQRAQINPQGLITFFEKITVEQEKQMQKIEDLGDETSTELIRSTMGFLSSHPATVDRIKQMQARMVVGQHQYLNLDDEFSALQAQVQEFVAGLDRE